MRTAPLTQLETALSARERQQASPNHIENITIFALVVEAIAKTKKYAQST